MLSRVADSLYWMSRYFERADNASRVMDATYGLILNPREILDGRALVSRGVFAGARSRATMSTRSMRCFCWWRTPEGAFSIVKCISGARENARQVREEISSEMWEHLNRLYHEVTARNCSPTTTPARCGW